MSLGNHYHWDELKSNPVLLEYEAASHMDFFRSDKYDHATQAAMHEYVHE